MADTFDKVVFLGDCNFATTHTDHQEIIQQEGFSDCYLDYLGDKQEEWTMPPTEGFATGWRPDRVLARGLGPIDV